MPPTTAPRKAPAATKAAARKAPAPTLTPPVDDVTPGDELDTLDGDQGAVVLDQSADGGLRAGDHVTWAYDDVVDGPVERHGEVVEVFDHSDADGGPTATVLWLDVPRYAQGATSGPISVDALELVDED
jgi:hypothetical protein